MSVAVSSLFEKLGGVPTVEVVVKDFYDRVLSDPDLSGFFSGLNMDLQTESQIRFLTAALGGPNEYQGRDMKSAHENLRITEYHFGLVASHLIASLRAAGVPQTDIDDVVGIVAKLKADIVSA